MGTRSGAWLKSIMYLQGALLNGTEWLPRIQSNFNKRDREVIRKIHYRVRNGDSLHRIADKFRVKVRDIKRWNQIGKKKYLQPGDELVLYVDVTQAS